MTAGKSHLMGFQSIDSRNSLISTFDWQIKLQKLFSPTTFALLCGKFVVGRWQVAAVRRLVNNFLTIISRVASCDPNT